jgi:ribose-phosphate pyrophosphokinase
MRLGIALALSDPEGNITQFLERQEAPTMSAELELFAFADSYDLARSVAERLDLEVRPIELHRFPDGESLVRVESTDPNRALVFRSLDHPNEKLFDVLLAADALRRQGVKRIGLVCPYLGYMRQDRIFRPGEPISQQVIAGLIDSAFDELLTIEAHLHRIHRLSEVFSCSAKSISAARPIAEWLLGRSQAGLVIGPDAESEPWIRSIAEIARVDWIVAAKKRRSDRDVHIELPELRRPVEEAWIVDDIASSGTTLEVLVRILKARGVQHVGAIVVHALMDNETPERLEKAGLDELVSSDSIVDSTNRISLAALLAREIREHEPHLEAS